MLNDGATSSTCCETACRFNACAMTSGNCGATMIGAAAAGPRRLMISTEICPAGAAWHSSRNGAGDDSSCTAAGRNTKTMPSLLPAASCRRRK